MANTAKMTINGKESDLKHVHYELHRRTEPNGKPATQIHNAQITITKDSLFDKGSATKWMSDLNKASEVQVEIFDEGKLFKKITFQNAKIIDYKETFNLEEAQNALEEFTICGDIIKVDDAEFKLNWPKAT